ncbi:U-box-domain-containing protein [Xylariaceae sp. AK1471]|nr:U-box-domain-containing protein [Xylariaceae sp. AK1471]
MAKDPEKAGKLKDDGNQHFTRQDYVGAESLYSKAPVFDSSPLVADFVFFSRSIIADDTNPSLYTNRAMARVKLGLYDSAISDCHTCLKLSGTNMKAYFILSQCLLALHDFDGAVDSALQAHRLGSETNDKSLSQLTNQVLQCKTERWEHQEKKRSREGQELQGQVIELMMRERGDNMALCTNDFERKQVMEEWDQKINLLEVTFEKARDATEKRRNIPSWALDDITFNIMVDPVITKTGRSYERAAILEALRRNPIDPVTREPLHASELRPNIGLRKACEEFLEENGWAADW